MTAELDAEYEATSTRKRGGEVMSEDRCPFCDYWPYHYMTHICRDCECDHREVGIPGEPHIGTYFESKWNPDCPVHTPETIGPRDDPNA